MLWPKAPVSCLLTCTNASYFVYQSSEHQNIHYRVVSPKPSASNTWTYISTNVFSWLDIGLPIHRTLSFYLLVWDWVTLSGHIGSYKFVFLRCMMTLAVDENDIISFARKSVSDNASRPKLRCNLHLDVGLHHVKGYKCTTLNRKQICIFVQHL